MCLVVVVVFSLHSFVVSLVVSYVLVQTHGGVEFSTVGLFAVWENSPWRKPESATSVPAHRC